MAMRRVIQNGAQSIRPLTTRITASSPLGLTANAVPTASRSASTGVRSFLSSLLHGTGGDAAKQGEGEPKSAAAPGARGFAKAAANPAAKAAKADKPKRPKNAFMHFTAEHRSHVISDNPTFKITEVASELGKRWKAMSEAQKAPFVALAEKEKAEYLKANPK